MAVYTYTYIIFIYIERFGPQKESQLSEEKKTKTYTPFVNWWTRIMEHVCKMSGSYLLEFGSDVCNLHINSFLVTTEFQYGINLGRYNITSH